jgi:hypothetical protein
LASASCCRDGGRWSGGSSLCSRGGCSGSPAMAACRLRKGSPPRSAAARHGQPPECDAAHPAGSAKPLRIPACLERHLAPFQAVDPIPCSRRACPQTSRPRAACQTRLTDLAGCVVRAHLSGTGRPALAGTMWRAFCLHVPLRDLGGWELEDCLWHQNGRCTTRSRVSSPSARQTRPSGRSLSRSCARRPFYARVSGMPCVCAAAVGMCAQCALSHGERSAGPVGAHV